MKRVHLFQKNQVEARKRAKELEALGYCVTYGSISPEVLRKLKEEPLVAVLIDLDRTAALGRDAGIYIRHYRATRNMPIVFINGKPANVVATKKHLPDAIYTDWSGIKSALRRAISHPPVAAVKPKSLLAGYSNTPLVKKLGIKPESAITLINPPDDFRKVMGKLPDRVVIRKRVTKKNDLMIWFVRSRRALEKRIKTVAARVGRGGLWIAWPKKTSRISSDLSQQDVRELGLNAGLVDYKVCAIDETWAGLKFARRN